MKLNLDNISSESIFISIAIMGWFAALLPLCFYKMELPTIIISSTRQTYYHHQFIELRARVRPSPYKRQFIAEGIPIAIHQEDQIITGIGNRTIHYMRYNPKKDLWFLDWPCPWNAPTGTYKAVLVQLTDDDVSAKIDYLSHSFNVARKPLYRMKNALSVSAIALTMFLCWG